MPIDQLITAPMFVAVFATLTFLVMLINGVIGMWQKLRPKEGNAEIINRLTVLTSRFDALDRRTTKIENTCSNCKEEYRKELLLIYSRINPIAENMEGIRQAFEFMKSMLMENRK